MAQRQRRRQVVMAFDEREDLRTSSLRGGKGANLWFMRSLGLPVPAGFTITTTVARAVMHNEGRFPKRLTWQLEHAVRKLERETGRQFGGLQNPLLVSVRSGAQDSMPGMMDTILNLGMNEQIRNALAMQTNDEFAGDCYRRFLAMYKTTVGVEAPSDPWEQLHGAIEAVVASWNSERAVAYRKACNIPGHLGTAVNVQQMVFGNRGVSSGTGVVFSRDPNTGEPGLFGEFLPGAQGEDVVSGSHTPMPLSAMIDWNTALYRELAAHVQKLEDCLDATVDVEFTVEEGKLWLLQCRPAKLSAEAAATFAVHRVWKKRWDHEQAVASLMPGQIESLEERPSFCATAAQEAQALVVARGLPASAGAVVGKIATTSEDACDMSARGESVILVREETTPNDLRGMLAAKAIVTLKGGATSHAAVVARQLGIPAVVGTGGDLLSSVFVPGQPDDELVLSVCGTSGVVYSGALPVVVPERKKEVNIFRKWASNCMPAPRIDFDAVKKRVNVNSILADVYLLEAMALASKGSAVGRDVVKLKQKVTLETAELFACYLCIAVASELRYVNERPGVSDYLPLEDKILLTETYGVTRYYTRGDEQILERLKPVPLEQQVEFFRLAARTFRHKGWGKETSFGGPKWAAIAEAGQNFLTGVLKHGVFVDHVFDLRHNGGPIFDKHQMVMIHYDGDLQTALLGIKRDVSGVGALFQRFRELSTDFRFRYQKAPWCHFTPSPEVLALWEKGLKANIWKETTA